MGSITGSGRSCGERNGNPLQYFYPENPMDRRAWWATVHRFAKIWTWLKRLSMHALFWLKNFFQRIHPAWLHLKVLSLGIVKEYPKFRRWKEYTHKNWAGTSCLKLILIKSLAAAAKSLQSCPKWNAKVKSLSRVLPLTTPCTAAYQASPSMGFSSTGVGCHCLLQIKKP